jgi:hypothetical protein
MNRLIIELPEHAYRRLVKRAEEQQKPPEQLVTEQLIAEFGILVRTQNQAKRIAKDYLASRIGDALAPKTPSLDKKRAVWQVPIAIELLVEGWTEVGTLEIDANTGCVLTESPTFSALWKRFRAILGIEDFPADKQARLSELLELNNDDTLTPEQKNELEQLMKEADAQEALNLQRLASRLPDRKRKNELYR